MARLERRAHHTDITSAVKRVVAPAVRQLDQLVHNTLALRQLGRVDKVGRAKPRRPLLLGGVHIHHDNLPRLLRNRTLNNTQPHTARPKHSDVAPLLNTSRDARRAVARRDAAPEQARAVHGRVGLHGDHRDVGHDRVLGEGRRAHEVQDVLAARAEARGAVRHDALALGCADLAAEVGLVGLAEFAFFAFGGAGECVRRSFCWCRLRGDVLESHDMVAHLDVGHALADRLDDARALVSQDDGEGTLGVLAGECVGICGRRVVLVLYSCVHVVRSGPIRSSPVQFRLLQSGLRTCVADAGVVDLDAHLVGPRRQYLDVLVAELLAGAPGDGGLAGDGLRGVRVSESRKRGAPEFSCLPTFPSVAIVMCVCW